MTPATNTQCDYILTLANKLTGESVRYASQSSVLSPPRNGWTKPQASALIDELDAAIKAHQEWQQRTGLIPGAYVRRHYTSKDGTPVILSGEVNGYRWAGLTPAGVYVTLDDEGREHFSADILNFAVERIGGEVAAAPTADLEAERARLTARIAEIDAILRRP